VDREAEKTEVSVGGGSHRPNGDLVKYLCFPSPSPSTGLGSYVCVSPSTFQKEGISGLRTKGLRFPHQEGCLGVERKEIILGLKNF